MKFENLSSTVSVLLNWVSELGRGLTLRLWLSKRWGGTVRMWLATRCAMCSKRVRFTVRVSSLIGLTIGCAVMEFFDAVRRFFVFFFQNLSTAGKWFRKEGEEWGCGWFVLPLHIGFHRKLTLANFVLHFTRKVWGYREIHEGGGADTDLLCSLLQYDPCQTCNTQWVVLSSNLNAWMWPQLACQAWHMLPRTTSSM